MTDDRWMDDDLSDPGNHRESKELREIFQSLSETARHQCSTEDIERVWRAVARELPAAERRELIDRMATDPALAEAWRVATELRRASAGALTAEDQRRRPATWSRSWMAAAALLLVSLAGAVVFQRFRPDPGDTFRTTDHYVVESLVPEDAALPRDAFVLRWTSGPPEARYQVRVTTEDLRTLSTAPDLTVPELAIDPGLLSTVAPGARVLWQVEVTLPGGTRVSSPTFATRVQ